MPPSSSTKAKSANAVSGNDTGKASSSSSNSSNSSNHASSSNAASAHNSRKSGGLNAGSGAPPRASVIHPARGGLAHELFRLLDRGILGLVLLLLFCLSFELLLPNSLPAQMLLNPPTPLSDSCTGKLDQYNALGSLCGFHNPVDLEAIRLANNKTLLLAIRHEHPYFDGRTSTDAEEYGLQAYVDGYSQLLWPTPSSQTQLSDFLLGVPGCASPPVGAEFRPLSLGVQVLPATSFARRHGPFIAEQHRGSVTTVVVVNQATARSAIEVFELIGGWDGSADNVGQSDALGGAHQAPLSASVEESSLRWMGCVPVYRQMNAGDVDILDAVTAGRRNSGGPAVVVSGNDQGPPSTMATLMGRITGAWLGLSSGHLRIWSAPAPFAASDNVTTADDIQPLHASRSAFDAAVAQARWRHVYLGEPVPRVPAGIMVAAGRLVFGNYHQLCRVDLPQIMPNSLLQQADWPPTEPVHTSDLKCVAVSEQSAVEVQLISHFGGSAVLVVSRSNTLASTLKAALCALGRDPCDMPWQLHVVHLPTMQSFPLLKFDGTSLGYATSVSYSDGFMYFGTQYGERVGVVRLSPSHDKLLRKLARTD